jgi:hypothetical protein
MNGFENFMDITCKENSLFKIFLINESDLIGSIRTPSINLALPEFSMRIPPINRFRSEASLLWTRVNAMPAIGMTSPFRVNNK